MHSQAAQLALLGMCVFGGSCKAVTGWSQSALEALACALAFVPWQSIVKTETERLSTEYDSPDPFGSMPTKYVVGLTSQGDSCACACKFSACTVLSSLLIRIGIEQEDDPTSTDEHIVMTDRTGSKYDCRIPDASQHTHETDLIQVVWLH